MTASDIVDNLLLLIFVLARIDTIISTKTGRSSSGRSSS